MTGTVRSCGDARSTRSERAAGRSTHFTETIKRSGTIDSPGGRRMLETRGWRIQSPRRFPQNAWTCHRVLPYNGSWACVVRLRPANCGERGRLPYLVCRSLDDFGRRRAHEPDTARAQYWENQSPDVCQGRSGHGPDRGLLVAGLRGQRADRHRDDRHRPDGPHSHPQLRQAARCLDGRHLRRLRPAGGRRRRDRRRQRHQVPGLPQAARQQGYRRGGRVHAGPLACPDHDDGLCGGQGRVRGEAPDAVRARRAVDDRRREALQARGPGGRAEPLRAELPAGPQVHPGGQTRPDRGRAGHLLPQPHARLRQSAGPGAAQGVGLGHVAGTGPQAGVQPQSRHLSLPLDLGLRRRADDQPGPAFARHRAVVHRRQAPASRSTAPAGGPT